VKNSFSFIRDGLYYRLLHRISLLKPIKRFIAFILITWLPLLIMQGKYQVFLEDIIPNIRFFVVVPLLIFSEGFADRLLVSVAQEFLHTGVIREEDHHKVENAAKKISRLHNSNLPEIFILIIAYVISFASLKTYSLNLGREWLSNQPVIIWYFMVSKPLFIFLIVRWMWITVLWNKFLWHMSCLDLDLNPTHPDRSAGLGFVSNAQFAFVGVVFSFSTAVSASELKVLSIHKTFLEAIQNSIFVVLIIAFLWLIAPMFLFTRRLTLVKYKGQLEYGALGQEYVAQFAKKWLDIKNSPERENFLGHPDLDGLADLQSVLDTVDKMRVVPMDLRTMAILMGLSTLPLAIVGLNKALPEDLFKRTIEILLG